ncbi:MAG: hypothetical protein IPK27_22165 [Rhodanobacteraceae bacterium]|nr:hypothetical protein [Rhodanobacteraceae bacterium]
MKVVEMQILACARDRVFASLDALNDWLKEKLAALNATPFQKRVGSRDSQLAEERVHLSPLPANRFEMASYLVRKVARDYHVDVHRQYYSVPHVHAGQIVEVRLTQAHVEVLIRDQRIALHRRAPPSQRFITDPAHMPAHHRAYADPKILQRAAAVGSRTLAFIETLFAKPASGTSDPQCPGRARPGARPRRERTRGRVRTRLCLDTIGYEHVRRLLLSARNQLPLPLPPQTHEHVRGSDYYSASHPEVRHAA